MMSGESMEPKEEVPLPWMCLTALQCVVENFKGKASPHSIAERRVPELIPVLGSSCR